MYAVVSSGGKQYRVEAGSELIIERVAGDAGSTITFDRVLLVGDGEAVTVGTPTVAGATVSGTVLGEALGPKLIVFKFKQKVKYRRKNGHRQHLTRVRVDEIHPGGKRAASGAEGSTAAAAAEAEPKAPRRRAAPKAKGEDKAETKAEAATEPAGAGTEKPRATRRRAKPKPAEE